MKWKTLIVLMLCMVLASTTVFANEVTLVANDQTIENDTMVVFRDGVLYGCVSEIAENFGHEVKWLDVAKLAVITFEDHYVSYGVDSDLVYVDQDTESLPHQTFIENNRLYAPLDELLAKFGPTTNWDVNTLTFYLNSPSFTVDDSMLKTLTYTDEDLLWLARIVDVETGDATVYKRMAIANVVLNRVKSERFPNTIKEVIFQSGQFPPSKRDSFQSLTPKLSSIIAAKRALEGENNISTCLFFNNRPFSSKSADFYMLLEGDYFYF